MNEQCRRPRPCPLRSGQSWRHSPADAKNAASAERSGGSISVYVYGNLEKAHVSGAFHDVYASGSISNIYRGFIVHQQDRLRRVIWLRWSIMRGHERPHHRRVSGCLPPRRNHHSDRLVRYVERTRHGLHARGWRRGYCSQSNQKGLGVKGRIASCPRSVGIGTSCFRDLQPGRQSCQGAMVWGQARWGGVRG